VDELRWVGWVTTRKMISVENWVDRHQMSTTALELVLQDEPKYGSKLHAVTSPDVGRVDGRWGRAACGVRVPSGDPSEVATGFFGPDSGAAKCRRCLKAVDG